MDGATGPMGPQGPAGIDGPQGPAGFDGINGLDGAQGPQGPAGNDGLDGATGPMGPQGPAGNDGLDGATGPMGPQGPAGNDGLDGATGPMGPQGPAGIDGSALSQNIEQVLIVGNDANGEDLLNTGKIGIGTATPNAQSSMEIATALPVIFPQMTQAQVDAITSPVPGMVQYNTTINKLQVYSNQDVQSMIANELYSGTESGMGPHFQSVLPGVTGNIVAVEVLVRQDGYWSGNCDFEIAGQFFSLPISNYTSLTWHTFYLPTPVPVTSGNQFYMVFDYNGSYELSFATNSSYLDGNGCCYPGQNDMLFRIHIETPGGLTWVNMH